MNTSVRGPLAWLPIAMSMGALSLLLGFMANPDGTMQPHAANGIAAFFFQVLMGAQVPLVAYFLIKWFPRKPKLTYSILTLQIVAALMPLALLDLLEH